jgi:hypothetical protein
MKSTITRSIALASILFFAALGVKSLFAEQPEKKVAPRFFELRIYTATPGKLDALHARFRETTLRMFEKHGISNIGYWTSVETKDGKEQAGKLYYIIAYPDEASRETMLIKGIAKDPAFLEAVKLSEKDGKLTSATESILLKPTDYSAIK